MQTFRTHAQVAAAGNLSLSNLPFAEGEEVEIIIRSGNGGSTDVASSAGRPASAMALLKRMAGTVEGPSDWAAEHDHYLYGTPKRGEEQ